MSNNFSSQEWYRVAEIKPRLRRDIEVSRHLYLNQPWYVISDATSGKVHRLTPAAYAIVGRLDGFTSLNEAWQDVLIEHGAETPSQDDVIKLITQLHNSDLLTGSDRPLLDDLLERRDKERLMPLKKLLINPLSATIPLVDPDRYLIRITTAMNILPGWIYWLAVSTILLIAAGLLPLHWSALSDRGLEGVLDLENILLLAFIYPIVKLLHEIGHGVATRSRGGEVHEMGVMMIAFYPIPYVEASASLAFPSKWDRAAVAAAGVIVELVIASIALFVWIAAEPGLSRTIAFNVMLIAGFSTLVINGNPLLRFDGYHVMCDIIEIPNLGKRGNSWWGEFARIRVLGTQERDRQPLLRWELFWFIVYPPLAFGYRIFISLTIALFVATTYRALGVVLAIWSLILSLVWPILKTGHKGFIDPRIKLAGSRAVVGALVVLVLILGSVFLIPAPHRTMTQGVVWLPPNSFIRTKGAGEVEMINVRHGQTISKGDFLFRQFSQPGKLLVTQHLARVRRISAEYSASLVNDRSAAIGILEALKDANRSHDNAKERLQNLTVKSEVDGVLNIGNSDDFIGRYFREGEVVGHILPKGAQTIRMVVRQDSIGLVRKELQSISLRFAHRPEKIHPGSIIREVPAGIAQLPSSVFSIDGGGTFATVPANDNPLQIVGRVFQFDIGFNEPPEISAPYGMRVFILLDFQPLPIGIQLARSIRSLFLSVFNA